MNHKVTKIVFGLWGIYFLLVISLQFLYFAGLFTPKGEFSTYNKIFSNIFSIVILTVIILAYRGKKWAYYVFMIYLAYSFINLLFLVGSILAGASYMGEYTFREYFMLPFWIFVTAVSFYILYRFKYPTTKLLHIRKPEDQ